MLVTEEPVLRRFWYPVMPMQQLANGPQAFQLLGQPLVLWLTETGEPAALADRCCHRTAQLSRGLSRMVACAALTTAGPLMPRVPASRCPNSTLMPLFPKPIECSHFSARNAMAMPGFASTRTPCSRFLLSRKLTMPDNRLIPQFYEPWRGQRAATNGKLLRQCPLQHCPCRIFWESGSALSLLSSEIVPLEMGLKVFSTVPVVNPPSQQKNFGIPDTMTVRHIESTWYVPFSRTLKITYPNGLMHLIYTGATPIEDHSSQVVQFCIRNDTEEQARAEDINAFDRQVVNEDKYVLESTTYDTPLDLAAEQHMPSDQPGIIMRHQLAALIREKIPQPSHHLEHQALGQVETAQ
jgi:phenylpropionate dioxygenase-like ring-hydroxylating dioxygenase large terminal subunit